MSKPTVYIKDRAYFPIELVKLKAVDKAFTHMMYDEGACAKCPYLKDRHSYMCEACASFLGETKTYSEVEVGGIDYVGLPLGRKREHLRYLRIEDYSAVNIVDKRHSVDFRYNITFGGIKKGSLRDYQKLMVKDQCKAKYGIMASPPRSGKTISAVAVGVEIGKRMLVLADQKEFLEQFEDHLAEFTNLPALEKEHGKKLYGRAKKLEDFKQFEIATCTIQTFYSEKGQKLLAKILKYYGHTWVDECHKAAAPMFLKTLGSLTTKVRWGATGTVERKDCRHVILADILGPVVSSSSVEALIPKVDVIWTEFKPKNNYVNWTSAMQWIARNEKRNRFIIDSVLKDVEDGHSVILPCLFREHILELTRRINAEYGSRVADYFIGGAGKENLARRKYVLADAKSGKIRVVVGTRSILQLGLNVPRWSLLYMLFPMNNKPNLEQGTARIRTPMDGKKTPVIRVLVDDMNQSKFCFKATLAHLQEFGFHINKDCYPAITKALTGIGVGNWLKKNALTAPKILNGSVTKVNGKLL